MPNWCSCGLIVTGDAEQLKAFGAKIADKFSFRAFVPVPSCLDDVHSGLWPGPDGQRHHMWKSEDGKDRPLTPEEKEAIDKDAGGLDPLDWTRTYWGTKWDACSPEVKSQTLSTIHVTFETAWSPPSPVVVAMSKQFPELTFELGYCEIGCGYAGSETYRGGNEVSSSTVSKMFIAPGHDETERDTEDLETTELLRHRTRFSIGYGG